MLAGKELDDLYTESYWALRKLSISETIMDTPLHQLFLDAYTLHANVESYYMFDSTGFFKSDLERVVFQRKYILPLTYCLKAISRIDFDTVKTKKINCLLTLYGYKALTLQSANKMLSEAGLPPVKHLNYRCSETWRTYPYSIRKIAKTLLVEDQRIQYDRP